MSKALICINTITSSPSIIDDLKNIVGVSEVHSSKGMYDIVALVKADSMNELREIVFAGYSKIR